MPTRSKKRISPNKSTNCWTSCLIFGSLTRLAVQLTTKRESITSNSIRKSLTSSTSRWTSSGLKPLNRENNFLFQGRKAEKAPETPNRPVREDNSKKWL